MITSSVLSDRNLILTGYIGANQLVIARRIAERLQMPFVDFERRLEDYAGMPMEDLQVIYGETRLKSVETEVIQEIILYRGAVILISGGVLMHGSNLARLRDTGMVVCLVATLDSILQRLHLALGARYHNPHERAVALGRLKREWSVRHLPGVREIDTSGMNDAEMIEKVATFWQQQVLMGQV